MAIPTVAEVLTTARAHLSDVDAEKFTDAKLLPFFKVAYRALIDGMNQHNLPLPRKEAYYVLPAYTGRFTPAQIGIQDFGELVSEGFWTAPSSTTYAITAATSATPIVITAVGHPFVSNGEVIVYQVGGQTGANGRWFCTVAGDNLTLRGSSHVATYTAATGYVLAATDDFDLALEESPLLPRTPMEGLHCFEWRADAFYVNASTTDRLIKLIYRTSGAAPSSGSVGIDNSEDFLAAFVASQASYPADRPAEGQRLMGQASTHLHQLLNDGVKALQRQNWQPRRYRGRTDNQRRTRAPYFTV